MSNIITLGSAAYQTKKETALNTELIRKEISLSEFNVVNDTTIEINGSLISVSKSAFNKILTRLQIPKAFATRFAEGFGEGGLKQLIQMMKTAKSSKNDHMVTLLVDPTTKSIIDVLPTGYASISNESFFDFIERYISGYNLEVTHLSYDLTKGIQVNTSATDKMLHIPGMSKEVFNTGVTFKNSPVRGLEVSPFVTRMVCANGMTSSAFTETFGLHQFTDKNVREFNSHMINMASSGFQASGLIDTIRKASDTDASLAELSHAANLIMGTDKNMSFDYIQRYAPINRANHAYNQLGVETSLLTKAQKANARSGMSMWDVVNGITNFASNEDRFSISDYNRTDLMMRAGNLLMKKNYDMDGFIDVNPFSDGSSLLTESEVSRLSGDA